MPILNLFPLLFVRLLRLRRAHHNPEGQTLCANPRTIFPNNPHPANRQVNLLRDLQTYYHSGELLLYYSFYTYCSYV